MSSGAPRNIVRIGKVALADSGSLSPSAAAAPAAWRSSRPRVGASSLVSRFKPTQSFAPVPACLES